MEGYKNEKDNFDLKSAMMKHFLVLFSLLIISTTSIFASDSALATPEGDNHEVINGHQLPPEPDQVVNDSTLLGIDINGNGVRDDVRF